MKLAAKKNKILSAIMTCVLAITLMAGFPAVKAYAASGTVYSCTINRCYAHPVTGVIEDSGGESSYATGQGMVEGCVYSNGILEVSDDGAYYLTIRMSLMDYTSGHSFWVQNVGDSGWSTPALGVTGNGTDSNGATADICIQVPSENCVVRGSMYVEPMGRDVIFYLYPSDYTAGNSTDMNAAIVTSASGSSTSGGSSGSAGGSGSGSTDTGSGNTGTGTAGSSLQSGSLSSSGSEDSQTSEEGEDTEEAPALSSSIEEAAAPSGDSAADTELNDVQGLSLSTAEQASASETDSGSGGNGPFAVGAAVTISGLILMGAAALIVYFFRKNWRRWGGGYDDDED